MHMTREIQMTTLQAANRHALIVDDHPLFCDALALTLQAIAEFADIEMAGTLADALEKVTASDLISLIVLDLNLPDVTGLDGLIRLRNAVPDIPILVVSSMADHTMIGFTIKAGAQGFVPKNSDQSVFAKAYEALKQGKIYLPETYISQQVDEDPDREDVLSRIATLTNQQTRILGLICEGKLNKQIAFDLSIAETTVKAHVTAIMRKLQVKSRTQAVLVAQEARFANALPNEG
jgi:DNA-binding NarL/FixJ family response regulator